MGNRYPLSLINDNNNFTGQDLTVVTIGDLNLALAMIHVYKMKYGESSVPNIDQVLNGLLPFDGSLEALTACVCKGEKEYFIEST